MKSIPVLSVCTLLLVLYCSCSARKQSCNELKSDTLKISTTRDAMVSGYSDEYSGALVGYCDTVEYFLTDIIEPQKLLLHLSALQLTAGVHHNYSPYPCIWITLYGRLFVPSIDGSIGKFEEYARGLGDGDFHHCVDPMATCNMTTAWTITHIEVETLSRFDARHPAGSSMNDLALISYASFYHYINSGYQYSLDPAYTGIRAGWISNVTNYIEQPITEDLQIKLPSMLDSSGDYCPGFGNAYLGCIEFTQAPDEPKQKIRVTLTLENGEKLRAETEIDFTVKP